MEYPKDLRPSNDRHTLVGQLARELDPKHRKSPDETEGPKDAWKAYAAAIISQTTTALLRGEYGAPEQFVREIGAWNVPRLSNASAELIRTLDVMDEAATPYLHREWLKTEAASIYLTVLRTLVGQPQFLSAGEVSALLPKSQLTRDPKTIALVLVLLQEKELARATKRKDDQSRYISLYALSHLGRDVLAMLDAK